jgi:hypothetical protein
MWANQAAARRFVILVITIALLGIFVKVYTSTGNRLSPPSYTAYSAEPPLDNPELIQNWIPATSYDYLRARLNDYLSANGLTARYISQKGAIDTNNGSYNFTLALEPQNQSLSMTVKIVNFNSIISTAVSINGVLQGPNGPAQSSNNAAGPQYTGLDALTNSGVTDGQLILFKKAIRTFNASATSVAVDTLSVNVLPPDPNLTQSIFTFTMSIGPTQYNARLICPDINSAQLILIDSGTHKQVFDSGTLND